MPIYTRTGDDGTTGLIGGTRVPKDDLRLEAYGTVDELNSWIGYLRAQPILTEKDSLLEEIQKKLFVIGGRLATDTSKVDLSQKLPCTEENIRELETEIDRMLASLEPQTHFILPGGSSAVSICHIARTVCRRAERRIYQLSGQIEIPHQLLWYINRLSDFLFVLSRETAKKEGIDEIQWKP
jgi:cob(I)alamin adenosyltransferase